MYRYVKSGETINYEYSCDWTDTITDAILDYAVSEEEVKIALINVLNKEGITCNGNCVSLGEFAWSVNNLSFDDYEKLKALNYRICDNVEKELGL